MYTEFYGLAEKPFVLSSDPRFFFLAASHREALELLLAHVLDPDGVAVLLGTEGSGKTALCRALLERVPADVHRIFVFEPPRDGRSLLLSICRQLGGEPTAQSAAELSDELCSRLRERSTQGRRTLLLIDDAHALPIEALEALCELCGHVAADRSLLSIAVAGRPELEQTLVRSALRMRCARRLQLRAFERAESDAYVEHRLRVAGRRGGSIPFTSSALRALHRAARGTPQLLHVIADAALQLGHDSGRRRIGARLVNAAASARPLPASALFDPLLPKGWSLEGSRWNLDWVPRMSWPDWDALRERSALQDWLQLPDWTRVRERVSGRVVLLAGAALLLAGAAAWQAGILGGDTASAGSGRGARAALDASEGIAFSASAQRASPRLLAPRLLQQPADVNAAEALARIVEIWGFAGAVPGRLAPSSMAQVLAEVAPLRLGRPRQTTLDALYVADRPAILELEARPGELRYAALVRLDEDGTALLLAGGRRFVVPSELLLQLWTGRALSTAAERPDGRGPRLSRR